MKNKFIIVLCCLLLAGGVSFAVGLALGGETSMWFSEDGLTFETNDEIEMVKEILSNDITYIEINIDLAEKISFVSGKTFSINYDKAKYEVDIGSYYLTVTQIDNDFLLNSGFSFFDNYQSITVTIPEDITLDDLTIIASVNELEISDIDVSELALFVDVGKAEIENSNFTDAYVMVDIGDISIENCEFENHLEAVVNIGNIDLEDCTISSFAYFKTEVGDLELDLIGGIEDYTIYSKIDIGNFKINGTKSDNENTFGNGDKIISVQVGTGNCDLDF